MLESPSDIAIVRAQCGRTRNDDEFAHRPNVAFRLLLKGAKRYNENPSAIATDGQYERKNHSSLQSTTIHRSCSF